MRLSDNDREILACAYFQAEAPLSKIADEVGIAHHTVRRTLENLLETGYIRRHAYINPGRIGFAQFYLSWRVAGNDPQVTEKVLQHLSDSEEVSWVSEVGAPYPFETVIYARNAHAASRVFERVTGEVGSLMIDKRVATLLSFTSFVPKFLSNRPYSQRSLSHTTNVEAIPIDDLDHNILRNITARTFTSYGQVARALGIAQSTLTYRIDRLKREGVILGEGYLIRRSDLVGMISFRLLTKLKKHSPDARHRIFEVCNSHPAVYYLEDVLGEYDVELSARVNHPREITGVVESLRKALPDIFGHVDFFPDIRTIKLANYPFVNPPRFP